MTLDKEVKKQFMNLMIKRGYCKNKITFTKLECGKMNVNYCCKCIFTIKCNKFKKCHVMPPQDKKWISYKTYLLNCVDEESLCPCHPKGKGECVGKCKCTTHCNSESSESSSHKSHDSESSCSSHSDHYSTCDPCSSSESSSGSSSSSSRSDHHSDCYPSDGCHVHNDECMDNECNCYHDDHCGKKDCCYD